MSEHVGDQNDGGTKPLPAGNASTPVGGVPRGVAPIVPRPPEDMGGLGPTPVRDRVPFAE